jgi:rfaE bifunctional protein kinase chain/domain
MAAPAMHVVTDQTLTEIRQREGGKRRVVFVSGNFNVLHPGHLRLLKFAADCGDFLVVGVHDDGQPGVLVPAELRHENVQSVSWIDYAFVLREPPEEFIAKLRPAVVVKGKEYETSANPEKAAVERYGGRLIFGSGDIRFSSLDLLKQEIEHPQPSAILKPVEYRQRHRFSLSQVAEAVRQMPNLKVCVVGDTIVDEYIACDPLGMSQEDPTIVVTPISQQRFIGGAAIVASHARSLGAKVSFFSVVGADDTAGFVRERLAGYGVDARLFVDESRPTTLKQRFRVHDKTLLRVSHLRQHAIGRELMAEMLPGLQAAIADADVLLFSDFNYGCLSQPLVDALTAHGARHDTLMAADSQSSSQTGDVARFRGMSLLCPTEREARLAVHDFSSGLVVTADALLRRAHAKNVIVTLGPEGLLVQASKQNPKDWMTDRLPAFNSAPKDVAGAGDSLFTCAALALALGLDVWQSAYLGALAASCQVARVGNVPLQPDDLLGELEA